MPELPDVVLYVKALTGKIQGKTIRGVTVRSPFVVRTFEPAIESAVGRVVNSFSRIGKRIVWHLDPELHLVFHLMITGRFHVRAAQTLPRRKNELIAFLFDEFTLMLTEAGTKKRASLHIVADTESLRQFDRGGLDIMNISFDQFRTRLTAQRRTLKRTLTDPRTFDGIGNAYSDEILHAAGLSPFKRSDQLSEGEIIRLFDKTRATLAEWIGRLAEQNGDAFPERVTAFRTEMAVHGKFGQPCPVCDAPVQRIVYADNEINYCAKCQTGGRVLADRSLSRLLKDEWPKNIDELE